jgi:protein-disulfide isomerase
MKKIIISIIAFFIISITGILFFKNKFSSIGTYANIEEGDNIKKIAENVNTKKSLDLPSLSHSKFSSEIESDIVLGSKQAKITIIEYASLSCPHCATFYKENFDLIDQKLIKTGKAKFIYRDFPLNYPALTATISAFCLYQKNKNNEQYYRYIKSLFSAQEKWAFDKEFEKQIKQISALYGLKKEELDKCLKDEELKKKVLQVRVDGSNEMQVRATPTIFINGFMLNGAIDFKKITEVIKFTSSE